MAKKQKVKTAKVKTPPHKKQVATKSKKKPLSKKMKVSDLLTESELELAQDSYKKISPEKVLDISQDKDVVLVPNSRIKANLIKEIETSTIKYSPKGSIVEAISNTQQHVVDMAKNKTKLDIIHSGNDVFDVTLRVLLTYGFAITEVDDRLFNLSEKKLPADVYYIRFDHKNFAKLATEEYRPNLLLTFRKGPKNGLKLNYCLYYPNQDGFLTLGGEFKADIFNLQGLKDKKSGINQIMETISNFLNQVEDWNSKINSLKEVTFNKEEMNSVKESITLSLLSPARINKMRLLWPTVNEINPFLTKLVYSDESNLFNVAVNALIFFVARRTPEGGPRSVRVPYFACSVSTFLEKSGKISKEDISASKLRLPFSFGRRTSDAFGVVNTLLLKKLSNNKKTSSASFFDN